MLTHGCKLHSQQPICTVVRISRLLTAHHIQTKEGEDGAPVPLLEGWVAQLLHDRKHLQTRPIVVLMLSVWKKCCKHAELSSLAEEHSVQAARTSNQTPTIAATQGARQAMGRLNTGSFRSQTLRFGPPKRHDKSATQVVWGRSVRTAQAAADPLTMQEHHPN